MQTGDPQEAAVFTGAAHALREQTGYFASVKWMPVFERIHADIRDTLGSEAFETAFAEGVLLRPREAIERALERFAP